MASLPPPPNPALSAVPKGSSHSLPCATNVWHLRSSPSHGAALAPFVKSDICCSFPHLICGEPRLLGLGQWSWGGRWEGLLGSSLPLWKSLDPLCVASRGQEAPTESTLTLPLGKGRGLVCGWVGSPSEGWAPWRGSRGVTSRLGSAGHPAGGS